MKRKRKPTGILWAVALILTGLVILLSSLDVITIKENIYFFAAIAIVGIVFHVACFINKPKKYSYLVPGGMMLVCAALFIACEYSSRMSLSELWPIIILAFAFGMLEQRVFSKSTQGSWSSIIVVSIIGFYFLIQLNLDFGIALGSLLIVLGVLIVVRLARHLPKGPSAASDEPKKEAQEKDEFDEI